MKKAIFLSLMLSVFMLASCSFQMSLETQEGRPVKDKAGYDFKDYKHENNTHLYDIEDEKENKE